MKYLFFIRIVHQGILCNHTSLFLASEVLSRNYLLCFSDSLFEWPTELAFRKLSIYFTNSSLIFEITVMVNRWNFYYFFFFFNKQCYLLWNVNIKFQMINWILDNYLVIWWTWMLYLWHIGPLLWLFFWLPCIVTALNKTFNLSGSCFLFLLKESSRTCNVSCPSQLYH